jgi:hypothetical protein
VPLLSLAVDGLTTNRENTGGDLQVTRDDNADDTIDADTTMPVAVLRPEQLEVYGWESSLWRKVRAYLGF